MLLLSTYQQARAARHGPDVWFICADCRAVKPVQTEGGTGYGCDDLENLLCYACCGARDRARMIETGRAAMYLTMTGGNGDAIVTNWPGTLRLAGRYTIGRHNIAGRRYDVYFVGPDGQPWHGVTYGDNTQICHCKRTKR